MSNILTVKNKKDEKFLRRRADDFDFNRFSKKEVGELVAKMRKIMHHAQGIGLSANQIGLNMRLFVAEVPDEKRKGLKFYAVFNPKIEKLDGKTYVLSEGCLSIPLTYGDVERPERIVLLGYDRNNQPIKIKAWGLLARVFQHEMDHLNGMLFIDKAKNIKKLESSK